MATALNDSPVNSSDSRAAKGANHRADRILTGVLTFGVGGLLLIFGLTSFWLWAHGTQDGGPSSPTPAVCVMALGLVAIGFGGVVVGR